MPVQFLNGKILFVDGAIAMDPACCPTCPEQCIQMGTSGSFTAPCNGTLRLRFNDGVGTYGDNTGALTVTINGSDYTVPGASGLVDGPSVLCGEVVDYAASGSVQIASDGRTYDADGNYVAGPPGEPSGVPATSEFYCHGTDAFGAALIKWSLIGRIGP